MLFSKINVFGIVRDHWATLRDFDTQRVSREDTLVFGVLPIVASASLVYYGIYVNDNAVMTLLACFAILTGLLFNLLVLVLDVLRHARLETGKDAAEQARLKLKTVLLRETFSNICYCVLLGIIMAVVCIVGLKHDECVRAAVSFGLFAGSINFVLTLIMVLKRMTAVLGHEFEPKS